MNPKQQAFVNAYLASRNATEAAKRAGYSERTAHVQGHRLLNDDKIAFSIREAERAAEARAAYTYDMACKRMADIIQNGNDTAAIRACERLAKLRGWDQPTRVQTQDVTPPRYDLSKLSDDDLEEFQLLLAKVQPDGS